MFRHQCLLMRLIFLSIKGWLENKQNGIPFYKKNMWEHSLDSAGEIALWSPLRSYVFARSWMDCWFTNVLPNPNKQQGICVNLTQMYSQCMLTLDLLYSSRSLGCQTRLCSAVYRFAILCLPSEPPRLEISQSRVKVGLGAARENIYLFRVKSVFFLIHG